MALTISLLLSLKEESWVESGKLGLNLFVSGTIVVLSLLCLLFGLLLLSLADKLGVDTGGEVLE